MICISFQMPCRLLLGKRLIYGLLDGGAADVASEDCAIGSNEHDVRDALDAIAFGWRVSSTTTSIEYWPGDRKFAHGLLGVVDAVFPNSDAHEVHLVLVLLGIFRKVVVDLSTARTAPRCPEIDNDGFFPWLKRPRV